MVSPCKIKDGVLVSYRGVDIVQQYTDGLSCRTIADRLGVTKTAIQRQLNKVICLRGQHDWRKITIDAASIVESYVSGRSIGSIASELGVSRKRIRLALSTNGIAVRGPEVIPQQMQDEILRSYKRGVTVQTIAQNLGFSQRRVSALLKSHGVTIIMGWRKGRPRGTLSA